jgi:hypothetical protein
MSDDLREPLIHSEITDELPDEHPLAYTTVECARCGQQVHAFNNECMQAWVETGQGNYCLICFVALFSAEAEPTIWGLRGEG